MTAFKVPPGKVPITGNFVNDKWLKWFDSLKVTYNAFTTGLVASRLVAADASGNLEDVADLTDWIAGTTGQINVTDDGDGTVTLSESTKDFGSLSTTTPANLTTAAVDTWYQIVNFTAEGSSVNMDPDPDEDHITIAHNGFYLMNYMFTGSCAAAHNWKVCVRRNNNATGFDQTTAYFSTTTANKYTVTGSGHLYLLEDDTVELWLMRLTAGADIVISVDSLILWLQLMWGM